MILTTVALTFALAAGPVACAPGETALVVTRSATVSETAASPFGTKVVAGDTLCAVGPAAGPDGAFNWPVPGGFIRASDVAALPAGWDAAVGFTEGRVAVAGLFGSVAVRALPSPYGTELASLGNGDLVDANPAITVTDHGGETWVPVRADDTIGWVLTSDLTADAPDLPTAESNDTSAPNETAIAPVPAETPAEGTAPLDVPRPVLLIGALAVGIIVLLVGNALVRRLRRKPEPVEPTTETAEPVGLPPAPLD
ncbi:SH3 domain-containing protein [Microbacterium lacus]|uniref:SH3 domain-containing protein n=1 Tax=Microbacterium lacus TaxID=415217 RepID=UPI00384C6E23